MNSLSLNKALIAEVRKRRYLYDKNDDNYSNRVFINQQWTEIGREIGLDELKAKRKWTTLRDYFQKLHRQLTFAGQGADKEFKKWYLYDSMLFLVPHILDPKPANSYPSLQQHTNSYPSLQQHTNSYPSIQQQHDQDDFVVVKSQDRSLSSSPVSTPYTNSQGAEESLYASSSHPSSSKKRRLHPGWSETETLDERLLETMSSIEAKLSEKETLDEDELFCKSLVSKIGSLDPFNKLECQAEIQMVILKFMRRSISETMETSQSQQNTASDNDHCE